jgi:hypothetical protein
MWYVLDLYKYACIGRELINCLCLNFFRRTMNKEEFKVHCTRFHPWHLQSAQCYLDTSIMKQRTMHYTAEAQCSYLVHCCMSLPHFAPTCYQKIRQTQTTEEMSLKSAAVLLELAMAPLNCKLVHLICSSYESNTS